jgi:hypothetical protein
MTIASAGKVRTITDPHGFENLCVPGSQKGGGVGELIRAAILPMFCHVITAPAQHAHPPERRTSIRT